MHPLQNGSQVEVKPPAKNPVGSPGYFTEGGEGGKPSYPGADWFNSVIAEFQNALAAQGITFNPESDEHLKLVFDAISNRLESTDGDGAQSNVDMNGKDWFIDDGFLVTPSSDAFRIKAGGGYVSGYRVTLESDRTIQVPNKPSFVYTDARREIVSSGQWATTFEFVVSVEEKDDYTDESGVKHFVCKIAQVLADGTVSDLRQKGKTLTSEFESFHSAFNSMTESKKIRTQQHSMKGKGGRSYVKVNKAGIPRSGDEFEFFNSAGVCYRMDTMTATIEQFGAIEGNDVLPVLAKALSHSVGLNRLKSEGGDYHIGTGHFSVPNIVNLELDLRQATLYVDEEIQTLTERLAMPDSISLKIRVGIVDFQQKFTWRLFTAFNAKRLRFKNDGEIRGARWPSNDQPVDLPATNLTGVLRYSGDDIKIAVGDCFDMYHKNYDGSVSTGGHLGRVYDGVGRKVRIEHGNMREMRTPIVNDRCDNIKWRHIDFEDVTDNCIYDLGCKNSLVESSTFLNCPDEPIVLSGINKKVSRCSFIDCGGRNVALSGYYRNLVIELSDFIHSTDLSAVKTRVEVTDISDDITLSANYFKGPSTSGIVNLFGNVKKVRFINKNRFNIELSETNPKYIETFGIVDELIIVDSDFGETGLNGRVISCNGSTSSDGGPTLLQTWNNEGLKEINLQYSEGAKASFELRSREDINPAKFTEIGEYKGNAHFVAPVTEGGVEKGFCISIALDDNIYSQDNVRTGGFLRFVKLNSDNGDPSVSMQFWSSKADGSGYELCLETNRGKKWLQ